jgi:hypothetical protein
VSKNPKVTLGLYTGRYVSGSCPMNVLAMAWELKEADMWGGMQWVTSCRVDSNRNYLIHDFLYKSDNEFLFILDEDMIHAGPTPVVLARRNLPIVSGLYFKRGTDQRYAPHFYKENGESEEDRRGHGTAINTNYRSMMPEVAEFFAGLTNVPYTDGPIILTKKDGSPLDSSLMRIDAAGFGCVMLRRDALEALDPPYLLDQPGLNGDLVFYKQAKEKGIDIWGDCSVIAAHDLDATVGIASFCDFTNKFVAEVEHARVG